MRTSPAAILILTAACSASPASVCLAQSSREPALTDPGLREVAEDLKEAGAKPAGVRPDRAQRVSPIRPHADVGNDPAPSGRVLPEGTFIVQMEGRVHKSVAGAWIFEPTELIDEAPVKPFVILPSQTLTRLIQIVGLDTQHNEVALTGEVSLYRGRNYLLISAITTTTPAESNEPAAVSPDGEPNLEIQPEPEMAQSVEELIKELEEARSADRAILQPTHSSSMESGRAPVPEGRTFVRRRARLAYMPAGEIAVVFDNDPDQITEAPLVVLPSHLLEEMERIVETRGDELPVRVSGQSYAYNGRSFLMPRSIVALREGELKTRQ